MTFFQKHKNTFILLTAFVFFFFDLKHSCLQYSKTPLDGDFANIVLPVSSYQTVLNDPLALRALIQQEKYPATNRFTTHFLMKVYFDNVPFWFQNIYNPIDSLYASITLAKMLIHIGFLFILSLYLATYFGFSFKKLISFSAIISPFLIVNGPYGSNIGFIDFSITYAFFYTLPIIFLMVFYFPIYRYILKKEEFKKPIFYYLFSTPFLLFLVLFGPLNAPLIFIINSFLFLFIIVDSWKIQNRNFIKTVFLNFKNTNKTVLYFLILGIILSLYSIYIGQFNIENDWCTVPLHERFKVLATGIYNTFLSTDIGAFWMIFLIIVNTFLILLFKPENKKTLVKIYFFLVLFIIVYCFLLPFGGCRSYRPFILRSDTFIPNLVVILFLISLTTYKVINVLKFQQHQIFYIFFFGSFCFYFLKYDHLPEYTNDNEKKALYFLGEKSRTTNQDIEVPFNCPIISWSTYNNFDESKSGSLILYKYGITKKVIRYKYKP